MSSNLFESISVQAAIENVYEDVCAIEKLLFEYTGEGKLEEAIPVCTKPRINSTTQCFLAAILTKN